MTRRAYAPGAVHSTYYGCDITRAGWNAAGIRWHAFTGNGQVRADTLAGIRELIRWARGR